MNNGVLYVCPTPIGNLEDVTIRVIKTLEEVDLIAAEDTRHTLKLLNHYGIKKPLTSYHEHNKKAKGVELIGKLKSSKNIALVTDAGMPGISDPGEDIIRLCIGEGIGVIVLPGPTAMIVALVASGLPTDKFVFEGFLPSKAGDRIRELERLKSEKRTIVLYEAPHRIIRLLEDMEKVLGDREVSISKELTKVHEEIFRGLISHGIEKFQTVSPRGEFVIVIKGAETIKANEFEDMGIKEHLKFYMNGGFSKRDAIRKVAEIRGMPKNLVYKESLKMK